MRNSPFSLVKSLREAINQLKLKSIQKEKWQPSSFKGGTWEIAEAKESTLLSNAFPVSTSFFSSQMSAQIKQNELSLEDSSKVSALLYGRPYPT